MDSTAICSSTTDGVSSWSIYNPLSPSPLFAVEINDLWEVRLIPQNALARTIAKAWGDRSCRMSQEFKGRGPGQDLIAAEALQAVVFRMEPVTALTSDAGPNHTRRLSPEQYRKCIEAITPQPVVRKAPARRKRVRR